MTREEGQPVYSKKELQPYKNQVRTTYVERRVPIKLENEAHELIDNWLKSKGYNPEEI